jgi:hypothetical protein
MAVKKGSRGLAGGGMANPMTTAGDLIRGGTAGAPTRVAVGTTGQVLTVAAGVPGWAAVDPWAALQSSDPMAGAGWSAFGVSGTGSAAWASSKFTVITTGGGAGAGGAEDADYLGDADAWDFAMRVDFVSGDGAAGDVYVAAFIGSGAPNTSVAITGYADGRVRAEYRSGGTTVIDTVAGPSSGQRTGGQLWYRVRRTPTAVAYSWGVGTAGALPTTWTTIAITSVLAAINASAGRHVLLYADDGPGSTALTVDVLAIRTAVEGAPL